MMFIPHPFVSAIETVAPIFLPSFTVRSSRNQEEQRKFPLIEYVIIRGGSKTYDNSKRKWRGTFEVQLGILLKEHKENFWCECDEFEQAKDFESFCWEMEKRLNGIIQTIIDPQSASKHLKFCDLKYSQYEFRLESYTGTQQVRKYDVDNLSGIYAVFNLSSYFDKGEFCCFFDNNEQGLKNQQRLVNENTVSYNKIQSLIDGL